MVKIPIWVYELMVGQGMNNPVHEKDGTIRGERLFGDLERTNDESSDVVSPGYMEKPRDYQTHP